MINEPHYDIKNWKNVGHKELFVPKGCWYFLILGILLFFLPMNVLAGENIATLRLKAEAGNADALYKLGVLYEAAPAYSYDKAEYCYRLAANEGNVIAQERMGNLYLGNNWVHQDYVKAYKWYSLAKASGYKPASEVLIG